ncbi:MAG: LysR family transcriptional regulator [Hyphomicrobiales bacterium]|nr:MAG: LysR family transcriptional regulator [Hyphomicrobiales bacterium]
MDIRLLETFRSVVDHRSATAAAAALGVTQPAVSAQIARLEETVGFRLFERIGGRLKPTPEGLLFYAETANALRGIDRLAHAAEVIRGASAGHLTIASHPSAAISLLPPLVAEFLAERPGVHIKMVTRASDVVSRLLPPESFDIAIAEPPVDAADFVLRRYRFRCVAVLGKGHKLARKASLSPMDLSGVPLVSTWRATMTHQAIRETFAAAGAELNVLAETEFFASACAIAASGSAVTIVDPLSATSFKGAEIVVRAFAPAIPYEICVFHRPGPSLLAEAFIDQLDAHLGAQNEETAS